MMVRRIVAFGALLFATHIAAGSSELSGDALKELVAGAVVEIDTPVGVKVPLRYGADGRVTGDARSLAYILGAPTDIGRWWVAADRLCHRWTRWFDGAVHCLRITQDGSRFLWRRDDGESGTATVTTRQVNVARAPNKVEEPPARAAPEPERPASATPHVATMLPSLPPVLIAPAQAAAVAAPSSSAQASLKDNPAPAPAPAKAATSATAKVSAMVARPAPAGRPTQGAAPPSVAAPSSEASGARQQELFRVVNVDMDDVLNVREGPSADHTIVGTIVPQATGVRLTGPCLSFWCPVSHRGVAGWVNSMYLAKAPRAGTSQRDR